MYITETLITLVTTIERQIEKESHKEMDPIEKLIRANAKNEVLLEIYKLIKTTKDE